MTLRSILLVALVPNVALADDDFTGPPGDAPRPAPVVHRIGKSEPVSQGLWGGGVRMTGLSGVGALPGVNIGGELAAYLRHDEMFGELAMGHWEPQETVMVTDTATEHVELALDVWSLRGGWASKTMPLRAWVLVESGELAGPKTMSGAVARMVAVTVPQDRRWVAAGGGFGVAWPMADTARLVGTVEFAVPVQRNQLMVAQGDPFEPDVAAARCALGLEVGWQ